MAAPHPAAVFSALPATLWTQGVAIPGHRETRPTLQRPSPADGRHGKVLTAQEELRGSGSGALTEVLLRKPAPRQVQQGTDGKDILLGAWPAGSPSRGQRVLRPHAPYSLDRGQLCKASAAASSWGKGNKTTGGFFRGGWDRCSETTPRAARGADPGGETARGRTWTLLWPGCLHTPALPVGD